MQYGLYLKGIGLSMEDSLRFWRSEFTKVMQLVELAYKDLGITQYTYRLSLRDKANTEKYVNNDEMWALGERVLREAMDSLGLP